MAFKLAAERRFKSKIQVKLPNESGSHSLMTFTAIFKALKISQLNTLQEEKGELPILKEVLVGFEDVTNEDGTPAEFSDESRDALLDEPLVAGALLQTYMREAVQGIARQKN